MLDSYWVLKNADGYITRFWDGRKFDYFTHPDWKEAQKFTDIADAHKIRKTLIGEEGKKSPWISLQTRRIKIIIE